MLNSEFFFSKITDGKSTFIMNTDVMTRAIFVEQFCTRLAIEITDLRKNN